MHLYLFMGICMCVQVSAEARETHGSAGAGVTGRHDLPYVGLGNKLGPLQEQHARLTTDTFFQAQLDNLNKIKSRGFPK